MGPTASGKTELAVRLAMRFPIDVVSVDSALVYRYMDIGTAKPEPELLRRVPHELIDIREPEDSYSAGDFVRDASAAIDQSLGAGRMPLLVGGTMMYFRALTEGIAELPEADQAIRDDIDKEARERGWPGLHEALARIDPSAAARINPNDSQRIQRALEVYRASGVTLTEWQARAPGRVDRRFLKIALIAGDRRSLHERIARRLDGMFAHGFVEEVEALRSRPGLTSEDPSMRAVGYRQVWAHLDGHGTRAEACERALFATRQLAKRQLTWLRRESELISVDPLEAGAFDAILEILGNFWRSNRRKSDH